MIEQNQQSQKPSGSNRPGQSGNGLEYAGIVGTAGWDEAFLDELLQIYREDRFIFVHQRHTRLCFALV